MKVYTWDFFGSRAEGIATHFEQHLREFLRKNGISNCETGTQSQQPGHFAAWCRSPQASEAVEKALRPKRVEDDPPRG